MDMLFGRKAGRKGKSADVAKDRLRLVLIHDRTDMTAEAMDSLKNDLLAVISRYVEIDPKAVNIGMTQEGREQRLIADIPLKPVKRRGFG